MKEVAIGIDIGGTNTVFGIVDRHGRCLAKNSISTNSSIPPEKFFKILHEEIEKTLKKVKEKVVLKGVGIGAPNGNFYRGTIEYAANLKWKGIVDVVGILKKYFNVPVILTNDANAAAIGEMIYGGAKGMRDFIVITLGTGLGSGIVANGELIYGHDGFAGELGHTTYDYNGRRCGCGRKGCLEAYVSAGGIKKTFIELLKSKSNKSELRKVSFNKLTTEMISKAAKKGDKIAQETFEITGKILGIKLTDTVVHTSPEAIFLFGGIAKAGDLIFKPVKYHLEKNLLKIFKNKIKILPSALKDSDAAILGASALVWKSR
ncbi:MAG: ROK family protein [Bacteroidales bacterium]|nr:ROK family protein [Bacteroidales bacterium]